MERTQEQRILCNTPAAFQQLPKAANKSLLQNKAAWQKMSESSRTADMSAYLCCNTHAGRC